MSENTEENGYPEDIVDMADIADMVNIPVDLPGYITFNDFINLCQPIDLLN